LVWPRSDNSEQAFRRALNELGTGVSTEFLIAATSERTIADPGEIIEAVEIVNQQPGRQGPDEDTTMLLLALGKAVTAIWSNLTQDVQHELFEHAVSAQADATRQRLAIFLHAPDGIKARAVQEPDSPGG
jgi:hypothetical protein